MKALGAFNYSGFDFDQSQIVLLEDCANGVEAGAKFTVQGIMEIGKALSAAREVFGQNDKAFGKWRQGRLPWLETRSALRFIQVYEKFLPRQIVEVDLMPSVLYALAAPSTPESAVVEIISRAQGGEKITVAKTKETIQRAKSQTLELNRNRGRNNVVRFPAPVVPAVDPNQCNLPLPDMPKAVDANPMMRSLGIPEGWYSRGFPLYHNLDNLYQNHFAGRDASQLAQDFVDTLPSKGVDLTCIWQLSYSLEKIIHLLRETGKSISHG